MPQIKLNANLRNIAGVKETAVQGRNLYEVISNLSQQIHELENVILDEEKIREHYLITINGKHSTSLNQSVDEDDIIAIFPPIAGG